jgi:hypothetical protein
MRTLIASLAAFALLGGVASAQVVDPQLWIGPPGATSPPGGTAVGGESNLLVGTVSGTNFEIGVAGNHNMQDPILLIVGIDGTAPNLTIGFSGCSPTLGCPLATAGEYGISGPTGTLNSTTKDAYSALGITDPGTGVDSESLVNWQAADTANGFTAATSYMLEAFEIPGTITQNSILSLSETGLPVGSFLIAYGCESPDLAHTACSGGDVGATPFTNAGLIDTPSGGGPPPPPPPPPPVPEPGSLAILGSALVGFGFWGWVRRRVHATDLAA